ncbi:ABC transporter permease [Pseudidiomarina gelatinasegens]|uniref:ABC transporter permease n=1 Tax=Pseudidiomarina gelatinasegens TaxID=2487740 RepID=A0A451GEX8_9GAMM|nr:ABC transporter permease [Pseudidiomarina gelatinasegens]RWU11668.1 ABC transporter permease [Pseudidiomarina gelatinasegens]
MSRAGFIHYDNTEKLLQVGGEWTLEHYIALNRAIQQLPPAPETTRLDCSNLGKVDFNTASLLADYLGSPQLDKLLPHAQGLTTDQRDIFASAVQATQTTELYTAKPSFSAVGLIAQLGQNVSNQVHQLVLLLNFIGDLVLTCVAVLVRPSRWRVTAWFYHMQQAGLAAIPIVSLMAFLVGAVVAFLGATVLTEFGATVYAVDLVAFGFMRELGVLLAAILLAGRTASSFTAQIGAMKVNEELDAMRVEQLDPIELLVVPRLLALLVMLPLLGFVSILAGLAGGAAVAVGSLDISWNQYLSILNEVPVRHFWVGMSKAPFFAVVIATIGCLEGFKVANSARSIGQHTTSSVVQALFAVILLDAIAALFFMEMNW